MKHPAISCIFLLFSFGGPAIIHARASAQDVRSLQGTSVMNRPMRSAPMGPEPPTSASHPKGLFIVDEKGRYSPQIFREKRAPFASGEKTKGTPDKYRLAVLGSSAHFGKVSIDRAKHQLDFDLEAASFPNWDGKRQVRDYTFMDGVLTYAVPASAYGGGAVAYSVWRRVGS